MATSLIISILLLVQIFFFIAVIRKNFAVIDIAWGLGQIVIGITSFMHYPLSMKNALLLFIVVAWGLRLALYIFFRSKGKPEDPRYTKLREEWRPSPNLNAYFKVFLFQGALMLIISLPLTMAMTQESHFISWVNWFGLFIWFLGFGLETYSDSYLTWWKRKNKDLGKICTTGPWKLCRFPNYFGEILLWYGIYFVAFEQKFAWTIIGPMTINYLIVKLTGIPPLEEKYRTRKDYQEYSKIVPRLIPFTKPPNYT